MKTISIRQPWASMIVNFPGTEITPPKRVENRKVLKSLRGTFLVHAGQKFDHDGLQHLFYMAAGNKDDEKDKGDEELQNYLLERANPSPEIWPHGGIIGQMDIVGVMPKWSQDPPIDWAEQLSAWWDPEQNGLLLDKVIALPFFECRGSLGVFNVDFPYI